MYKRQILEDGLQESGLHETAQSLVAQGMRRLDQEEDIFMDEAVPKSAGPVPESERYLPDPVISEAFSGESAGEGLAQAEDFSIPEEAKRVVTAGGKIIETDTEALKKKLESKKAEKAAAKEPDEASVQQEIKAKEEAPKKEYVFPPVSLLKRGSRIAGSHSEKEYKATAIKLQQTLRNFGVGVTVTNISCGPSVKMCIRDR